MKVKYIPALAGIGALALFAVPGVASASTTGHPGSGNCAYKHVPQWEQGRAIWVLEGHGWNAHCVLVQIRGGHHPTQPGHGTQPGHHTQPGHGHHHG